MKEEEKRFVFDVMMDRGRDTKSRIALAGMLGVIPQFDLACIGISIHGLGAFTFEALACLASADVVYCYPPTVSHYELLKLINTNLINLHETLYAKGSDFDPAYDAIIKEVMLAVRSGKKVVYATQGSPAFHCGTAASLHRTARREGFASILVSGVSSFELLSAELAADYDITSIQICSIVRLAERKITINPHVPCLLFDLGRYALPAVRGDASTLERPKLAMLADLLRAIYPIDHEVVLMYILSTGVCAKSKTTSSEIENALIDFGAAPTIFLPAIRMPA